MFSICAKHLLWICIHTISLWNRKCHRYLSTYCLTIEHTIPRQQCKMPKNVIFHGLNMDWKTLNQRQIPIHLGRRNQMKLFCIGNCLRMIHNMHRHWPSLADHLTSLSFRMGSEWHQSGVALGWQKGELLMLCLVTHCIQFLSLHQLVYRHHRYCHNKQKDCLFGWSVKILLNSEGDKKGCCWFCLRL